MGASACSFRTSQWGATGFLAIFTTKAPAITWLVTSFTRIIGAAHRSTGLNDLGYIIPDFAAQIPNKGDLSGGTFLFLRVHNPLNCTFDRHRRPWSCQGFPLFLAIPTVSHGYLNIHCAFTCKRVSIKGAFLSLSSLLQPLNFFLPQRRPLELGLLGLRFLRQLTSHRCLRLHLHHFRICVRVCCCTCVLQANVSSCVHLALCALLARIRWGTHVLHFSRGGWCTSLVLLDGVFLHQLAGVLHACGIVVPHPLFTRIHRDCLFLLLCVLVVFPLTCVAGPRFSSALFYLFTLACFSRTPIQQCIQFVFCFLDLIIHVRLFWHWQFILFAARVDCRQK